MRAAPVLVAMVLAALALPAGAAAGPHCPKPDPSLPYWARARTMTVLNDSVLLSGESAIKRGFMCWRVHLIGEPALTLRAAEQQIRSSGRRVAPLVVVGIGYNSLWERNRANHARWAARFDDDAHRLLRTLFRAGAQQVIWVTLRRANHKTTSPSRWRELGQYSWYFPYVNERLRLLDGRRNKVILAEWAREGARPDVTYDSIHLNALGGKLMQRLIERRLYEEAHRQAEQRGPKAKAAGGDPCANINTGVPRRGPGRPRPPLVLGDSSELLAVAPLVSLGLEANARGCRPLSSAVDILSQRRAAGTLPRVAVLGVGANGGVAFSHLRRGLRIMGKRGKLGMVTTATTPSAAQAMRTFHARHPRRTVLIDWAATGQAGRYGGDGIHIGYEGEAVLARYIHRFVRPYIPPHTTIRFPKAPAAAKDCEQVHPGGRNLQVVVIRGRDRVLCSVARELVLTRDKTASRYFRWFDWRFLGKPPWKDVFVRNDGKVVIAARVPVPPPDTDQPAR